MSILEITPVLIHCRHEFTNIELKYLGNHLSGDILVSRIN